MNSNLVRQSDFSGGEVAPIAQGRTDSPAYQHGLRLALNMIPTLEGQLLNRPGTRYIGGTIDPAFASRLMPFTFTDGQTFILEFAWPFMRVIQNGAFIMQAGLPLAVPIDWLSRDLMRLKFAQSGDIITVTHPAYQPREIARISNTSWTITPVSYVPNAYYAGVPTIPTDNIPPGEGVAVWSNAINYAFGALVNQGAHLFTSLSDGNLNHQPDISGVLNLTWWKDLTITPATGIGAAVSSAALWDPTVTYALNAFVLFQVPAGGVNPYHLFVSLRDGNLANTPVPLTGWFDNTWYDATYSAYKTYAKGAYVWFATTSSPTDGMLYVSLTDQNRGNQPAGSTAWWVPAAGDTRPTKQWQWVITQVWSDQRGVVRETLASIPSAPLSLAIYTDRPAQIAWAGELFQVVIVRGLPVFVPLGPVPYVVLGYNIYRGRNGIFGFVGNVPPSIHTFNDDGLPPNYGVQPPRGTNPFDIATGPNTKTQSWPGVFTYHEQRALYARSDVKPQDFWGSALAKLKIFDVNIPVQDSDAFDFKPSSERLEEIRSMLSLRYLLLFTSSGVWGAYGAGGAISPSSINLRRYSQQGAAYLDPIAIERAAIYLTNRGRVRDLNWDWRSDMYAGRDISVVARHLFEGHTIQDWCYAETPYSLVWAVRDDGVLLSLTYSAAGVEAWAQHTTLGVFERVAAVTETDPVTGTIEDAVYVVTRRLIGGVPARAIERFSTRLVPLKRVIAADLTSTYTQDVRVTNFLDASLQFDGRNQPSTVTLSGATYNGGDVLNLVAAANFILPGPRGLAQADIGAAVVVDPEGLAGGPVQATILTVADGLHATVRLDANLPVQWQNVPVNVAFAPITLTGLGYLNAMQVTALIDGGVSGPFTVVAGSITLDRPGVIVQVGLPYTSDMDLLDIGADQVKTNVKSVRKATFEVVASRGLKVGESFDKLREAQVQTVAGGNAPPPLTTGNVEVVTDSSWNTQGGRACLRQTDPLPLTVVAVVREVVIGGR